MEIIFYITTAIEWILWIYFGFAANYVFLFALASLFPYRPKPAKQSTFRKIAVLIPGYKEDAVIVDVAKDALNQDYPSDQYDVVVIADSFQPQTLNALRELPIRVVEVSFEKSTKSKALNRAMATIGDEYDIALVLDADNLMETRFLTKVNDAFDRGYWIVQGHRAAKNLNTPFAILEAVSEEVNNQIFRKGHRVLGLSSALIGSGMAFDYAFFKETMANVNAVGGFDKELELKLLRDRQTIEYLPDAIVLDEKVQKSEVFANQRRRWLSAQFIYFKRYAWSGLTGLLRGNVDFADKVYQMISPPRVLLLGIVTILAGAYFLINLLFPDAPWMALSFKEWRWPLLLTYLGMALAVPRKFYNLETLKALFTLPRAFALMFLSLFKLKGANKKFIHTQHGTIEEKTPKS
ncbi:MAG: glycosyltransferase [Mameliella sp.]|nr:glycosyltransferase [Phaeodactylibacter sp.]